MRDVVPSAYVYALESLARARREGSMPERSDITVGWVTAELEDAGRTLQLLPVKGVYPNGYGSGWPDMVHSAAEAYGWTADETRPPKPSARDIAQMDRAYNWIGLIPESRRTWRRLILMRSLVHWKNDKYIWSWRKIARSFDSGGYDGAHKYWQSQWEKAIDYLRKELAKGGY